jgi:hypothetical protein
VRTPVTNLDGLPHDLDGMTIKAGLDGKGYEATTVAPSVNTSTQFKAKAD